MLLRYNTHNALARSVRCARVHMKATIATDVESRRELDRIDELIDRAEKSWETEQSKFLSPLVWSAAIEKAKTMADVRMVALGGHPNAERRVVVCGREESMFGIDEASTTGIVAMEVRGNFMFDKASHPDFLGAILGTGIERWNIGDILVEGEDGATVVCLASIADHLSTCLVKVRTVSVTTRQIPWEQVRIPELRTKDIKSVEASLRIDAIASAGFGCSRSKASDAVKDGAIKMNWQVVKKPSVLVEEGVTISMSGKGRLKIVDISDTAKGKFVVSMKRYY